VFRRNLGGKWEVKTGNPKYSYNGLPEVVFPNHHRLCFFMSLGRFSEPEKKMSLRESFDYQQKMLREFLDKTTHPTPFEEAQLDLLRINGKRQFATWLKRTPTRLREFIRGLVREFREQLDFSPSSLQVIEQLVLRAPFGSSALFDEERLERTEMLYAYIGEVIRKSLPTWEWGIDLDDEQPRSGIPWVSSGGQVHAKIYPLFLLTDFADSRKPKSLLDAVTKLIRRLAD